MAEHRGLDLSRSENKNGKPKKNHILAIAIDQYSNGHLPLSFPVSDCERLINLLVERYGFDPNHVTRLYNDEAIKEILVDELYNLEYKLGSDDNLLLIFAGHGYYDKKKNKGYWISSDARLLAKESQAEDLFISFQRIVEDLDPVQAHHIVFIFDSCFGGKFGQVTMKAPDSGPMEMNHPEDKPSRWVLSSGRIEEVLDESPFAKAMHEVLAENTKPRLPIHSFCEAVYQKMETVKTQTPYWTELVTGEIKGGGFVFHLQEEFAAKAEAVKPFITDSAQLLQRLRQGSREYRDYLEKGRFAKLNFEEILLPGAKAELLQVEVRLDKETTPLQSALEQLWKKDTHNTLLCGEGGMGKTMSCWRLWKDLLNRNDNQAPVPIFIPLNEYNGIIEKDRQSRNYLFQFIAREYLDDTPLTTELENALKQLFKTRNGQPTAMLMLDGFNEVTVESQELMIELHEFVRRAGGVQIVVTSRYEMRNYAWTQGFDRLDLLDLTPAQIEAYLHKQGIDLPGEGSVVGLLGNPMMLTLYTGASQLRVQFAEDKRLRFKERVTTKGELLHNFTEGQLAKFLLDNPNHKEEFLWQAFLVRHLLPFIAWSMVEKGQFFIHTRKLLNPEFNFKSVIGEAYAYFNRFDFTDHFPLFAGHREWLGFGISEEQYDESEGRNRRIRKYLVEKLYLLTEEADTFRFLHQNFRDYLAAVHVQRDMELTIFQNQGLPPEKRRFPKSLRQAPLDFYVRQILGELEGEQYNKPVFLEDEKRWSADHFIRDNLLARLLEHGRGVFDQAQTGYTLWNLLTIWEEQRGELSGANVSELDLQDFYLNGRRASRPGLEMQLPKGKITAEDLFPQGHSSVVRSTAYSPEGGRIVTGSDDKTAKVWDAKTGQCLLTLQGHSSVVRSTAYSPEGGRIVTGSSDKTAKVWDAKTGQCLLTLQGHSGRVMSTAYSPEGGRIVTGSDDKTAKVWDAKTGQCLLTLQGHSAGVSSTAYSPEGGRIVTGSDDKTAKVWDAKTGQCLLTLQGHSAGVSSTAYSPEGGRIVTGSDDKTAKVWDAKTGQCLLTLQGHSSVVRSTAYSPEGGRIVTGSSDKTAKVWDAKTGQCLLTLQGHSAWVSSTAYSPEVGRIVTGSSDKTAKVWDAKTGQCLLTLQGHSGWVMSTAYSPEGGRIVTGSDDKTAKVWDAKTGQCLLTLQGHSSRVNSTAYSPEGGRIVTGSSDNTAKVWDAKTGQCLLTLQGHSYGVNSTAYSPEGGRIVTGSSDNTAKVWDAKTGQCLLTLQGHSAGVMSTAYSPEGGRIVTGSFDNTAKVWDAKTGQCLLTLQGHSAWVMSTAYSPEGGRIVTGSSDDTAKVWDAKTGQCLLTLQGHSAWVSSTAYSPEVGRIVTGSDDKTAKVWDAKTGQCLLTLQGHSAWVMSTAYSPEGGRIVTGSEDNTAKVWDAKTGQCLLTLPNIPGLIIQGCDFRELHPESKLSKDQVALLRQYGGIFDDKDARQWGELMARHFGVK